MKSPARLVLVLGSSMALTACSMLVGKSEDLTIYAPTFARPAESSAPVARAWELSIAEPRAISPLDGARIAVMPSAGEMQTYKGARWRDVSPVLIQQLLLQAFRDSSGLAGVGAPTSVLHADYLLLSDLQDFQAEYRGAKVPTVVIRMNGQLVDQSTGRALATRTFAVEETSAGADMPEVFAAFQLALNKLLPQVVDWAVATGDANWTQGRRNSGSAQAVQTGRRFHGAGTVRRAGDAFSRTGFLRLNLCRAVARSTLDHGQYAPIGADLPSGQQNERSAPHFRGALAWDDVDQLTAILRAWPFPFFGNVRVKTPLS